MIFITVGSQKFQFDRLLKAVDDLIESKVIKEEVFAQTGYCEYQPKYFDNKQFIGRDEFKNKIKKSNIVITHAGTGAIINALKQDKKVIAVPRLAQYGEHVDDHQLQIIKEFEELELISACYEIENLIECYKEIDKIKLKKYKSKNKVVIKDIDKYLGEI